MDNNDAYASYGSSRPPLYFSSSNSYFRHRQPPPPPQPERRNYYEDENDYDVRVQRRGAPWWPSGAAAASRQGRDARPPAHPVVAQPRRRQSWLRPMMYETAASRSRRPAARVSRVAAPMTLAAELPLPAQTQPQPQEEALQFADYEGLPESRRYTQSPPPVEEEEEARGENQGYRRRRDSGDRWDTDDIDIHIRDRSRSHSREAVPYPNQRPFDPAGSAYQASDIEYDQRYRPGSPGSDDMDAYDEFQFNVPSGSASRDGDLSDLDVSGVDADSIQTGEVTNPAISKAIPIYSSHYSGSAEQGGFHSATMTALSDLKGPKRPLFRWLHLCQDVMNFDAFWAEVSRNFRLSEEETAATAKLRADVKRLCVKSRTNSKGVKVGYIEPRYVQVIIRSGEKQDANTSSPGFARWICLPYFSLQQYSGLLSGSSPASFPPLTLLQAEYPRSPQSRDMEQAVCQLGTAPRGECFHIAQIWCLVLHNSVLVTCGSMSQADLRGDIIKVTPEPSRPLTGPPGPGRILVAYSGAVTWSFRTDECLTWFAFLSHFQAFWPQSLVFTRGDQTIDANNWSKVLKLTQHSRSNVTLTAKKTLQPDAPQRAVLAAENPLEETGQTLGGHTEQAPEFLHVLTLFNNVGKVAGKSPESSFKGLKEQLQAAETFLWSKGSYSCKKTYKSCVQATRAEVHAQLREAAVQVEAKESEAARRSYEERVDIFNAADIIYRLFLPANFDGPTITKFWGSLSAILQVPELEGERTGQVYQAAVGQLRNLLRAMSQDVQAFQSIVSYAKGHERANMELPRQFVTAWLHLLSAFVYFNGFIGSNADWYSHLDKVSRLIHEGMQKMIQNISSRNLLDNVEVLPVEVGALVAMELLKDKVGKSDDISETYSDFLSLLDTDIKTKPSDRSFQRRIDLVQQEMGTLKKTMNRQRYILACLSNNVSSWDAREFMRGTDDAAGRGRRTRDAGGYYDGGGPPPYDAVDYNAQHDARIDPRVGGAAYDDARAVDEAAVYDLESASKLSPTDPAGLRRLLLKDCLRFVEQREFDFRRNIEYAEELKEAVSFKMSFTKDRQENAIYAFTIVTIIFLPLSSIAGIFGMNTTDVRDMKYGQWLYWATAVPVTLLIIIVGLWWMNELGNVLAWMVGRRPRRGDTGQGSLPIPQEQLRPQFLPSASAQKLEAEYRPAQMTEAFGIRPPTPVMPYNNDRPETRQRTRHRQRAAVRY